MHELTHLEIQRDKDGAPKWDDLDRPKLKMRKHDYEIGVFVDVAKEYGMDSFDCEHVKMVSRFEQNNLFEVG